MDEAIGELRAMLARARPTAGTFEQRRARWTTTFQAYCPVPAGTSVTPWQDADVGGEWVIAHGVGGGRDHVLIHFHGGGYTAGSAPAYRGLAARLSAACARPVLAVDYRLAPEHPFPAALDDCVAAYRWLVRSVGVAPANIVLAGDSAGGNFMVATMLRLRSAGETLPAAAVGLSAQFDMSLSGESVTSRAHRDPMISPESIRNCAAAYIGAADPRDPLVSPLFADLRGLPPLLLQVGSEEMLRDDNFRMTAKAKEAGVEAAFEEWPDMVHVWHMFSDRLADARKALERIGAFVQHHSPTAATGVRR
ncbi:MAG TPA: alpha/beta hydrolase [Stellaceae bacterium]|nr:alpha/beta hydrolase [Stellaceae bacterium]